VSGFGYDPDRDPRHLPNPEEFLLDRELAEVTDELETNSIHLHRFESMQVMFETAGWANFVEIVAQEADLLDARLSRDVTQSSWTYLRGQRVWCDFILQMPQAISKALNQFRTKQAELNARAENVRSRNEGGP
jgi:hypothetical protein